MQPLKFRNGYVISSHTLQGIWLLIHAEIKLNHVSKRGHRASVATELNTHQCISRCLWVDLSVQNKLNHHWDFCGTWTDPSWTHQGQVMHIYIYIYVIIGSDNGLSPIGLKRYAEPTIRYDTRYSAHDTIHSAIHFNDLPLLAEKQRLVMTACNQEHRTLRAPYWLRSNDVQ